MMARKIVAALGGQWLGGYGICQCVCHDDGRTPSLKIRDEPSHSDGIDLHCFGGCNWQQVKAELRRRGLLSGGCPAENAPVLPEHNGEHRAREAEKTRALVEALWHQCRPAPGTLVDRWLTVSRQIDLSAIGGMPPSIRFHPALRHGPTGMELPAQVAAIQAPDRRIVALHRTYLTLQGTKAPLSQNRMMLGPCSGGAVRLAKAGETLAIGEGIETCLSAAQILGLPVWAALSTGGLRSIILPPEVREVVILQDNDQPGIDAAQAAAERLEGEGRWVRIQAPPAGCNDWNDVLLQQRGAA